MTQAVQPGGDHDHHRLLRRDLGLIAAVVLGGVVGGDRLASVPAHAAHNRMLPWIVGRATGIAAYLLLVALVGVGMWLSHPWRTRWPVLHPTTRLRSHVVLSVFVFVFVVLHVAAMVSDRYAGVGWLGALVPGASHYRSVPVALGTLAVGAGLAAGVTAWLANSVCQRIWKPIHRLASGCLALVWFHGVLAGTDTAALSVMYALTGAGLLVLGVSRYAAGRRVKAVPGASQTG